MTKHFLALLPALVLFGCAGAQEPIQTRIRSRQFTVGQFIDTHTHLDARVRGGREKEYPTAAKSLLSKGSRFGLAAALIMPPPQLDFKNIPYDYRDMMVAAKPFPNRLGFLGGGGTLNPILQNTSPTRVTPKIRQKFHEIAERILRSGAVGFGELATLHFSNNPTQPFEETTPDHPLLLLLADISAQHHVPIDLHMEAVTSEMKTPEFLVSGSNQNPLSVKENITAFERLLAHNRSARIIWAHAGWDNTGHRSVSLMRRLMTSHTNLYMSLKFRRLGNLSPKPLRRDGTLRSNWLRLMEDFPDRFVIGVDGFTGLPDGKPQRRPPSYRQASVFLNELPPELGRKVGFENAIKLFDLQSQRKIRNDLR